jgi:AcrR family transcriptional regulator
VAAELFASRGYAATTYDDLVAASGLSRGGFYFHFRTKEDLAMAVIDTKQRQWEDELSSRLCRIGSATGRLAAFGPELVAMQIDDPSGMALATVTAELTRVPGLAHQARAVSRRWIDYLATIVSEAQAEGGIRSDLDAGSLAVVLIGSMAGIRQVTARFPNEDSRSSLEVHFATWTSIVRQGLLPEAAGQSGPTGRPADRSDERS